MVEVWRKARKKAVLVEFREVMGEVEIIHTLEGDLEAHKGKSFVIRGVNGEIYPIDKQIFAQTCEVVEEAKFISPLFCRWKKFLAEVLDNCEGDEWIASLDSFDADMLSNLDQLEEYGVSKGDVELVVRLKKMGK